MKKKKLILLFFFVLCTAMLSAAYNQAIYLNGSDNYIEIPDEHDFDIVGPMTIEIWIKVDQFTVENQAIVTKGETDGWAIQRYGTTNFIEYRYGTMSLHGSVNVNDGLWHHVAVLFIQGSNTMYIYIDGELDNAVSAVSPFFLSNEYAVDIGANAEVGGRLFHGTVDELRIWVITRTQSQIQEYMNQELTGTEYGLVAYYTMDNDFYNPSHIIDCTGNDHTGILQYTWGSAFVYTGVIFMTEPGLGDGTQGNPYQISSADELFWITWDSDRWDKHYIQTADIDASATASLYGGQGHVPIGNSTNNFSGCYNGQNFTLDGLVIDRSTEDNVGLFGYSSGADMTNIRLTNADITGDECVGGIVGTNSSLSDIERSMVSGSITGSTSVGGVVGYNILNSQIYECYNNSDVSGVDHVGGIAGNNYQSSQVSRSYNEGSITGTGTDCGGIAGYNHSSAYVQNSYDLGEVDGVTAVGGVTGNNDAFIDKCYSIGVVSGSSSVGGLVGFDEFERAASSFWNTETSGQVSSRGGTGKTSAQMKEVSLYTTLDSPVIIFAWDFVNNPYDDTGTDDIWNIDGTDTVNDGYPILTWQAPIDTAPSGSGTFGDPYQVANLNHLMWISENTSALDKYFEQIIDIDAADTWGWDNQAGFSPIGNNTNPFSGSYDGQHYTISNLFIDRNATSYTGLFGKLDGAVITNLSVTDADITGIYYSGCLTGWANNSTITYCNATGQLAAGSAVGGLVGEAAGTTILNCYADVNITGVLPDALPEKIGGFAGCVGWASEISNCYAVGDVYGQFEVGGFIGDLGGGNIDDCYSSGEVTGTGISIGGFIGDLSLSTVSNSFWNTVTSGQGFSAGGIAATTTQMTNATTTNNIYLDAGWDFKGAGAEEIWNIGNGRNNSYPYLDWQYPSDPSTLPVILSDFTVEFINNTPNLYWETQSEVDNMGWNVYRNIEELFSTSTLITEEMIPGIGTTTEPSCYNYKDHANLVIGQTYYYWLESINYNGVSQVYSRVAQITIPDPSVTPPNIEPPMIYDFKIVPNPVNGSANFRFTLDKSSMVSVSIYNIKGELIRTLPTVLAQADEMSQLYWNGKSLNGNELTSGVYFYNLNVNGKIEKTNKLILIK